MVGLIQDGDERAYREEVRLFADWCRTNNLVLNVEKTKEMVIDFRRNQPVHAPIHINGTAVEIVKNTKFLGVHVADNLSWDLHTSSLIKKALPATTEEGPPQSIHPDHFLQGHHRKCFDQQHFSLV